MATATENGAFQRCRKLFAITLAVMALALMAVSAMTLLSSMHASQAQMFLDDWGNRGELPSEKAWHVAAQAAERSTALSVTAQGKYLDRLGRVYEWQHVTLPFGATAATESRQKALAAYRSSIETRPLWPYTWVQLAFVKLRLLEFDQEFDRALQQANQLGPTRVRVQAPLAEISFIAWPQMDEGQRQTAWQAFEFTLGQDGRRAARLKGLIDQAGLTDEMCRVVDSELTARRKWCS